MTTGSPSSTSNEALEDTVVEEYDVFWNEDLNGLDVSIVQFPLRPQNHPYDQSMLRNIRHREENKMIEMSFDYPANPGQASNSVYLDTVSMLEREDELKPSGSGDKSSKSGSDQSGSNASEPKDHDDILAFKLRSSVVETPSQFCIGVFGENELGETSLHLTPVSTIYQMRPALQHVDVYMDSEGQSSSVDEPVGSPVKGDNAGGSSSVQVTFQRRESERAMAKRMNTYQYIVEQQEMEKWKEFQLLNSRSARTNDIRNHLCAMSDTTLMPVEQGGEQSAVKTEPTISYLSRLTGVPMLEVGKNLCRGKPLRPSDYVDEDVPDTSVAGPTSSSVSNSPEKKSSKKAHQASSSKYLASLGFHSMNVPSLRQLGGLTVPEQIAHLMRTAKVMSFYDVKDLVTVSSDADLIQALERIAILVRGVWVLRTDQEYPHGGGGSVPVIGQSIGSSIHNALMYTNSPITTPNFGPQAHGSSSHHGNEAGGGMFQPHMAARDYVLWRFHEGHTVSRRELVRLFGIQAHTALAMLSPIANRTVSTGKSSRSGKDVPTKPEGGDGDPSGLRVEVPEPTRDGSDGDSVQSGPAAVWIFKHSEGDRDFLVQFPELEQKYEKYWTRTRDHIHAMMRHFEQHCQQSAAVDGNSWRLQPSIAPLGASSTSFALEGSAGVTRSLMGDASSSDESVAEITPSAAPDIMDTLKARPQREDVDVVVNAVRDAFGEIAIASLKEVLTYIHTTGCESYPEHATLLESMEANALAFMSALGQVAVHVRDDRYVRKPAGNSTHDTYRQIIISLFQQQEVVKKGDFLEAIDKWNADHADNTVSKPLQHTYAALLREVARARGGGWMLKPCESLEERLAAAGARSPHRPSVKMEEDS